MTPDILLMVLSFLLGAVCAWFAMVRTVTREVGEAARPLTAADQGPGPDVTDDPAL